MAPRKSSVEPTVPPAPPSPLVVAILQRVVQKMDSSALFEDLVERAAERLVGSIKVDDILEHVLGDIGALGPILVAQLADHLSHVELK